MSEVECCDTVEVHEDLLKIVQDTMPDEQELNDLADLFKIFGDYTRIRILFVLFESEVCVCDDTVCNFTSVEDPEAEQTGEEPQRRQVDLLFARR